MYACWEVRQLLAEGRRFPSGSPVSSANETDRHDMTEDVESGIQSQSKKVRFITILVKENPN